MQNTRELINEFITTLDKDEYVNITSRMNNDTEKNRIIDAVYSKMMSQPGKLKIENVVSQIELSFYS
jgi:hypothetical protein